MYRFLRTPGSSALAVGSWRRYQRSGGPLQAAAISGNLDIVQFLIHAGANVNSPGLGFGDALQAASLYGNDDIVRLLLENGANVRGNGDGPFGTSALQAAMLQKHYTTAHPLLQQ
jgi:ankyrin repeat protein